MKHLYFDESGYTGNDLLGKNQPTFCYLGLDCRLELEREFIALKSKYKYSDREVKGTKMLLNIMPGRNFYANYGRYVQKEPSFS